MIGMKVTYLILITLFITACDSIQFNNKNEAEENCKKEFKEWASAEFDYCMLYISEKTKPLNKKDWDEIALSCKLITNGYF